MDNSPDLLRAFLMGTRMTLQAYRLADPSVGENKALGVLFEAAASSSGSKFDQKLAQRIVDVIQEVIPAGGPHRPAASAVA